MDPGEALGLEESVVVSHGEDEDRDWEMVSAQQDAAEELVGLSSRETLGCTPCSGFRGC